MRWSNLFLPHVTRLESCESQIARWRYGEVETCEGQVTGLYARWWPRIGSELDVAMDNYLSQLRENSARFYYAFPLRSPGYMTILYAHSGPRTSYATLYRGIETMDAIAKLRRTNAIVCQATNAKLEERTMNRWGYVRHALALGDNHYIKRLR
jgi:hypothetical protein